jgi:hypothetical protein
MKTIRFLTAAAISIALTFTFSSCSSDDDEKNKTGGIDEKLVSGGDGSGGNEAWVSCNENSCDGLILQADGNVVYLYSEDGSSGPWEPITGTWSTNGNKMTLNIGGEASTYTYTISGDTFTTTIEACRGDGDCKTKVSVYTKQSVTYE